MKIPLRQFCTLILLFSAISGYSQNIPIAYAGPDVDICLGDTVQLQGSATGAGPNYTYQWSPNTNISDPTIPNPLVWPATDTEYSLVVTSNNLSSAPDTIEVRSHPIPTVNAGADQEICLGDTAQLDASGSGDPSAVYQYTWSPASSLDNAQAEDPQAFPLQNTTYYVEIESLWGCLGNVDSVLVFVRPTPIAEAGTNTIVCIGDSFALEGSYAWATPDTLPASQISNMWSPDTSVVSPGSFHTNGFAAASLWMYLEVNAGVCTAVDSVFITAFPRPVPIITQTGNTLNVSGGLGGGMHQWYINNVAIPGATNTSYTFTQPGCYSVSITEGNCSGESDTLCVQEVSRQESFALQGLEASPNPFQDEIRLKFDLIRAEEISVSLINLQGMAVRELPPVKYGPGSHFLRIEAADLSQGMYLLRIRGKNGTKGLPVLHF